MRKVKFGELKIGRRFFDITQGGKEFIKISWTHARDIQSGREVEFLKGGLIYIKGII